MPLAYQPSLEPSARIHYITKPEQAEQLCEELRSRRFRVTFDTETIGHNIKTESAIAKAECVCWSLCHNEEEVYYLHNNGAQRNMIRIFEPWFRDDMCPKQGHNIKYDMHVVANYGMRVEGVDFDTIVGAWLVNEARPLGLEELIGEEFGEHYKTYNETFAYKPMLAQKKPRRRKDTLNIKSLEQVIDINNSLYQPRKLARYASKDAWLQHRLADRVRSQLKNVEWIQGRRGQAELSLFDYFNEFEAPFLYVLYDMEQRGMWVDQEFVAELDEEWQKKLVTLENAFVYNLLQEGVPQADLMDLKIGSHDELATILFDVLGYPSGATTDKGKRSVAVAEIQRLVEEGYTAVQPLLEHRKLVTLVNKFTKPFGTWPDKQGRIHTSFRQHGTDTGRLSSAAPNLQNIPRDNSLRNAFGAKSGSMLVQADLSQIELRMMAHSCKDKRMVDAFNSGADFHTVTARRMNPELADLSDADIKKHHGELRTRAKTTNFGILYGQREWALSKSMGITEQEAATMLRNYFAGFPAMQPFMEGVKSFARQHGYVRTLLRRYRQMPDINSSDWKKRAHVERTTVNTVIQGSAADWVKMAMIALHRDEELRELGGFLQLQIHDELLLEAPRENAAKVQEIVVHYMEHPYMYFGMKPLLVPVKADSMVAMTWAEAK